MKPYANPLKQSHVGMSTINCNVTRDPSSTRAVIGVWVFHGPDLYKGVYQDTGGRHTHDGTFLASQELMPFGCSWRMKILEKSPLDELLNDLEDGLYYRYGLVQSESHSGALTMKPQTHGVTTFEHRELMAALKEQLEARFGQIAEMNVLFQETRSMPLAWHRQFQGSLWRRIWNKLPPALLVRFGALEAGGTR